MGPAPPLETLTRFERAAVRLVRRMNAGRWQRWWFWHQRHIGAGWIGVLTDPLLEIHGLEEVLRTTRDRPLLLVANHRTLFDLYVVMAILFRRLPGWRSINFPVRGRFFYQNIGGLLANGLAAFWAMYPPFFRDPRKRRFDQWALGELVAICRAGPGRLVGFHPEGTRNRDPDPWSYLPAQPGVGHLILEARPQVIPVFIAGLDDGVPGVLSRRFRGGAPIRVWFGGALAYESFGTGPSTRRQARALADFTMAEIQRLGELDRAMEAGRVPR
jgi:1-acyl-sn-glycerol-3-phosphate acyltransferase